MLSQNERKRIIALINREVVPGHRVYRTDRVALCTARAAELLGSRPEKVAVRLSANILKNAMGRGIPGTGMIGLPIAVALGALVGRSEYRLEVLRDVTPGAVGAGPPVYRRKARMYRPEGGYRRETLYRGRGPGRRALWPRR